MGSDSFGTGGWALTFVSDWFQARSDSGKLAYGDGTWEMSETCLREVLQRLHALPPAAD